MRETENKGRGWEGVLFAISHKVSVCAENGRFMFTYELGKTYCALKGV